MLTRCSSPAAVRALHQPRLIRQSRGGLPRQRPMDIPRIAKWPLGRDAAASPLIGTLSGLIEKLRPHPVSLGVIAVVCVIVDAMIAVLKNQHSLVHAAD